MKPVCFFICFLFGITALDAAQIVGTITDAETGTPIPNATVHILNTDRAAQTDPNGQFVFLNLSSLQYTLHISHVAYHPTDRMVQAKENTRLTIALFLKTMQLNELSVTAKPVGANDIHQNPSFATIIPRSRFEGRETSLPDVLAEATGVQVKRLGGLGSFSTISLRGSSAEQVEVYLDGILLNAAFGGGVDLSNMPLSQIGQIEVYRGAGAEGNGLGGTVHIRTRPAHRTLSHSLHGSWGAFDTRSLNGMISGGTQNSKALFVADYTSSNNNFAFLDDNGTEYNKDDDVITSRQNNHYRAINLLGKWHQAFSQNRNMSVHQTLFWKHQGIPGISNNQSQHANLSAFRTLTELVYEDLALIPNLSMRQSIYITQINETFKDPEGEVGIGRQDNAYQTRTCGWLNRLQPLLFSHHDVTAIIGLHRETYKPTTRIQSTTAFFESQRWILSGRLGMDLSLPAKRGVWSASAEMRRLYSSFTGANPFNFSPLAPDSANTRTLISMRSGIRLNILSNLIFKANLGHTLRTPSFFELFGDRGGVVGNVNLRPEYGLTYDVGLRYANHNTLLETVYFDHRYEDLIQFVHTSQATSRPVNIGKARVQGVEITAQKTLWKSINISGNYTYQRAKDRSDIPHLQGNTLSNRSPHTLFARLTGDWGRYTAFYNYTFEDGNFLDQANLRPLSARHIHNVGLKINLPRNIQFGIEAKNLLNTQIADTWGYPLPGRSLFINVQEHF